jgi:predicted phosphodiesterase
LQFGGVEIIDEAIHVTADGRRLLVIHGDAFDAVVTHARWLALLGDGAYTVMVWLNRHFNTARRRLGYPYWSLSAYLKQRVKNAVQYIASFGDAVADEARRRGADGVVCGHIHHAEIRDLGGILYCNSGDWVESCTALVEDFDGSLEVVSWMTRRAFDPLVIDAALEAELREEVWETWTSGCESLDGDERGRSDVGSDDQLCCARLQRRSVDRLVLVRNLGGNLAYWLQRGDHCRRQQQYRGRGKSQRQFRELSSSMSRSGVSCRHGGRAASLPGAA